MSKHEAQHDANVTPPTVNGTTDVTTGSPPRKKRRVFLWVFAAIQVIFLIWVITGFTGADNTPAASEVAKFCGQGGWQGLYDSYAACVSGYGDTLKGAGDVGTAIGGGIVILFWFITDAIVGGSYALYRLARRPR